MTDSEEGRQRRAEQSRKYRETHAKQIADYGRRYREAHAEQIAGYKRVWREQNPERIAGYREQYDSENRERLKEANLEHRRNRSAEEHAAAERRARKAEEARQRYHADIEVSRAKAREYLAQRRAADPEGYREGKKRRNAAWREGHKDEINAKLREKNLRDPEPKRVRARRDYEKHGDERRASRRRYYQENRDRELARQKQWRNRERRRVEAGLPVRRLHRVLPNERDENEAAAAAFFAREVTLELREQLKAEIATPQELIDAWRRECARIRAADYAHRNPEVTSDTVRRRAAEEARLDDVARAVNNRLRLTRRPEANSAPDPAYLPQPSIDRSGLGL